MKLADYIDGTATIIGPNDAREFIRVCVREIGHGFHPDTSFNQYVTVLNGKQVFNGRVAAKLDKALSRVWQLIGGEVYSVGLTAIEQAEAA